MDRNIKISTGNSRKAIQWPVAQMTFSQFADRLKEPVRSDETYEEYLLLEKAQQDELKDVGGFVGGEIEGRRKPENIRGRDLITLDLDSIPSADDYIKVISSIRGFEVNYVIYSTRKHRPDAPRLRVILPMNRTVSSEEYEAVARKVASIIGMEYADRTTFQPERLMYWPSVSKDAQYMYEAETEKELLDADMWLSLYGDWKDVSQWPGKTIDEAAAASRASKQEDPCQKKGIVGAFCRTYNILQAMDKFLPGTYIPTDADETRFTYSGGSTAGGAIIYEDGKFLYSHHATDPAADKLCNSFDLVRLHKYGADDDQAIAGTPVSKLPSYTQMVELVESDEAVMSLMREEKEAEIKADFESRGLDAGDTEWLRSLELDKSGGIAKTLQNAYMILRNDPRLAGRIVYDEFEETVNVIRPVPWDSEIGERVFTDFDDSALRLFFETEYGGFKGRDIIFDAVNNVAKANTVNRPKEYLNRLVWDGTERLDRLFIDYLGAEDSDYNKAVARKSITAAVARILDPGCKYDSMPILAGPQGAGKSTLLAILGGAWFTDSLLVFTGKEAMEMLRGTWIVEVGELNAMRRAEINAVKHFLSKRDDKYRAAYGKRTQLHKRTCVFFGTTNEKEFLQDPTGNRRFWPVDIMEQSPCKSVFEDLAAERDQIWAEAVQRYKDGEKLFLEDAGIFAEALNKQKAHSDISPKTGEIEEFVDKLRPEGWEDMSISDRRTFLSNDFAASQGTEQLKYVCSAMVWRECYCGDPKFLKKSEAKEINDILRSLPDWEEMKSPHKFKIYGNQRGFKRL